MTPSRPRDASVAMTRTAPELFTLDEAAGRLRVSRRWLLDFLRGRPYGRMAGRKRLFTEADIAKLIEELPCPSSSSRRAKANRQIGRSAASTSGRVLTELRERLTKGLPKGSSQRSVRPRFPE